MSGDYSRITFDPWQDDLGVLLQQGRPLSDAEWNALTLQLRRRIHAGTLDTIGTAVVPMQTPDAFEIGLVPGNLTIGRGRIYVDGLLAENHGAGTLTWEPRLEESIGTELVRYMPEAGFTAQPYYPNPPALPGGGPHLVYLDVWQREVTHLVRPELIEKAVGVDSTTRLQTVWQVKLLEGVGSAANCSTPLDQINGWLPAHAPSAGRLTTATAPVPGEPDPCLIPPGGGYKGLENQLYRIEIHQGGTLGTATFKWSRDNASVETRVTHIPALNQLIVESVGRDSVLRFSDGDWIEITDDWLELHNLPGELHRIKIGNGVDDATRTITLDTPLTAGLFPTDVQHRTQPGRHTRIKRWDQRGKVLDKDGNELQDLDLAGSSGEITVPLAAGLSVLLEHGIIATFALDPAGGQFKSGDYWVFAARSTDATIEELDQAPPLGIHHHYAKLGFVTFPNTPVTDCREFWPPPVATGGESCACTVCVTPQAHASGQPSLQMAIDQVIQAGGGTICLEVGTYDLKQPLLIQGAQSLRVVGKGRASLLRSELGAVLVDKSHDIVLSSFSMLCRGSSTGPGRALALSSSSSVLAERLEIELDGANPLWAAIGLGGALTGVVLRDNAVNAGLGIVSDGGPDTGTGLMDLRIEDNVLTCQLSGIRLTGVSVHQFVSRLSGNRVVGCTQSGFELTGATVPGFGVEVTGNEFFVLSDAIVAGLDGLRIVDNDLILEKPSSDKPHRGIVLIAGADGKAIDACEIHGNRILGFSAAGIAVTAALASVAIGRNHLEKLGMGIQFEKVVPVQSLAVRGNQFVAIESTAIHIESSTGQIVIAENQIMSAGAAPTVAVFCRAGDCTFSDNQCRQPTPGTSENVQLAADTLIVASNRAFGGKISMNLKPGMANDRPKCTVVGNITTGQIQVLGGPLQPPWTPLNLQGT